jgi:putative ABC transport system permease protein
MKFFPLLFKNLLRRRRRAALTASSVAVCVFILVALVTLTTYMKSIIRETESRLIVITRGRYSFLDPLPYAYRAKIERVPGVVASNAVTLIIGTAGDKDEVVNGMALIPETYLDTGPQKEQIPPQDFDAFVRDRSAILVGPVMARRFGWKIGDSVTIRGSRYPVELRCRLVGYLTAEILSDYFAIHRAYLEEALGPEREPGVHFFPLKVESREAIPRVIGQIDALFANSAAETKSEPQRDFMMSLASLARNIRDVVLAMGLVIVLAIVLVVTNSMAISVRERTREMAVLKALGFTDGQVLRLVLGEAVLLALSGGVLGGAFAYAIFASSGFDLGSGPAGHFAVQPLALAAGLALSLLIGVAAGAFPALHASRLRIVEALRWVR